MQRANNAKRIIGHVSVLAARAVEAIFSGRKNVNRPEAISGTNELDRTGICVNKAERLKINWCDDSVIFPFYEDSLAHSFWRAQEFSLFRRHQGMLRSPLLDFGCGDGSFAAALFNEIDFGVDIDPQAMEIASQFRIYLNLVQPVDLRVPLPDCSVASVISNSVLEHVSNLELSISEISRLLIPGGLFLFTVPVTQFERDLEKYFGATESRRVNAQYFHRNLLEVDDWRRLLKRNRLEVISIQGYQPSWFSFYYIMFRFFGNRALGRVVPNIRKLIWKHQSRRLIEMVRESIDGCTQDGANIFVIAKKVD